MSGVARFTIGPGGLSDHEARDVALRLHAGALIIYPTDTLYAVGCRARDGEAVGRLRAAKLREDGKPLPVIVADLDQARSITASWPKAAQELAAAFWPGPLTIVAPAAPSLPPPLLAGGSTIAVRVPSSDVARALAGLAGPLVSTSANLAGDPPCLTADLALAAFPAATLVLDAGPLDGPPSTIVDVSGSDGEPRILREGRIDRRRIEACWPRK